MGWDSNPRGICIPSGFQDRCLKPLGHPSIAGKSACQHSRSENNTETSETVDPIWTQIGSGHNAGPPKPFLGSAQHAPGQDADDRRGARIGFLGTLGIYSEKHRWIMAAARGNDMNWHSRSLPSTISASSTP